jgi:ABC-type tungstate transport system substrate-binding protein
MVVLGRAPGAVNLRTRDIETAIAGETKTGRELKSRFAWLGRALA